MTGKDSDNSTTAIANVAFEQLTYASSYFWKTASSYTNSLIQQTSNINYGEYLPSTSQQYLNLLKMDPNHQNNTHKEIYYVSFNQDSSSLAVCHEGGYHLYNMNNIEHANGTKFEEIHKSATPDKVCIVERLFQSSLITLVTLNHSRRLQVFHFKMGNEICSHSYTSSVKAIKMNRKRVVVCLEESIHVHNIRDMRLLHMIRDTPTNRDGLIDLCSSDTACYLAYPGSATQGHVNIFDADPLIATCTIAAHEAPLAALRFNSDGTKLATASVKGTVIRVFSIPSGERLYEFTRGMKRCVTISSLAFSYDSKYLCSSSNTETVHVFSLAKAEELKQQANQSKNDDNDQSLSSWVNYFSQQASNYLPQQMNVLMLREKSYATARLPIVGSRTCCAMPRIGNRDYLAVASTEGYLFCYSLPQETGECTLARQFRIGPLADEESGEIGETKSIPSSIGQIYPSIDNSGDNVPSLNLGSTPPIRNSGGIISSSPVNGSPLSSSPSPVIATNKRQKSVSQSSTGPPQIYSSSPANTTIKMQPSPASASTNQKNKGIKPRKSSISSGSSIGSNSGDGSIGSVSSGDRKSDPKPDLNNFDDFPPLGNFDDED